MLGGFGLGGIGVGFGPGFGGEGSGPGGWGDGSGGGGCGGTRAFASTRPSARVLVCEPIVTSSTYEQHLVPQWASTPRERRTAQGRLDDSGDREIRKDRDAVVQRQRALGARGL